MAVGEFVVSALQTTLEISSNKNFSNFTNQTSPKKNFKAEKILFMTFP